MHQNRPNNSVTADSDDNMSSYSVFPPRDDSLLSTPEETTPHGSQASDLGNRSLSPVAFTCAQDTLPLLAAEPTLSVKTAQSVGKLH